MTHFNILDTSIRSMAALITALGLLTTLCGSADAATVHHVRPHHPHYATSGATNSFAYQPARPPVRDETSGYDEAASGHEASTYGGVTLLPDD